MKHEIDLGSEVEFNIKYAGKEYSMREPTVEEIDQFRAQDVDKAGAAFLVEFLDKLGMPKDVVLKMGMSKARQLIDGMMDMITKKK